MAEPANDLLAVRGLSIEFRTSRGWTRVLDDVSLDIAPGEILGLVGESGSGKSVTSLALMRLLPAHVSRVASGSVHLDGTDVLRLPERRLAALRGNEMAMVFQEPMSTLNPAFTIGNQIVETLRRHGDITRSEARQRAIDVLARVGIPRPDRVVRNYPHQLSGGMRQRAVLAMAICCEPKLLIADEPTTALDVTVQAQVLDLLRSMRDELGMAILFITHDLGVVAELCERVAVMYAGQIVETAPVEELFASPRHPYTEGLLRARPTLAGSYADLRPIPGTPPMPGEVPVGCRFAPRCKYAVERCQLDDIELLQIEPQRSSRCIRIDELMLEPAP